MNFFLTKASPELRSQRATRLRLALTQWRQLKEAVGLTLKTTRDKETYETERMRGAGSLRSFLQRADS